MIHRIFVAVLVAGVASPALAQIVRDVNSDGDAIQHVADDADQPSLARVERQIVRLTNDFRDEQGRTTIETDPSLQEAAESFANFMAKTDKYGHTADGNQPSDRAAEHGYEYCIVAENIAFQFSTAGFKTAELAQKFVEGWEESPEHRKNMLDRDVTEIGVAVAQSPESKRYYAVQMFGRPKSRQIEFQVANESEAAVTYTVSGQEFELPPRSTRTHARCRPSELSFGKDVRVAGRPADEPLKPRRGDRYTVTGGETGPVVVAD